MYVVRRFCAYSAHLDGTGQLAIEKRAQEMCRKTGIGLRASPIVEDHSGRLDAAIYGLWAGTCEGALSLHGRSRRPHAAERTRGSDIR